MVADALERLLARLLGGGSVLAVGGPPLAPSSTVRELARPQSGEELEQSLETVGDAAYDAALLASWGPDLTPEELARAVRDKVRPGGVIVITAPTTRRGWRGARGALVGMIKRRKPVPLEELCEALLLARLRDVSARELDGSTALGVVWATVP
jgi:hypothetical protein